MVMSKETKRWIIAAVVMIILVLIIDVIVNHRH